MIHVVVYLHHSDALVRELEAQKKVCTFSFSLKGCFQETLSPMVYHGHCFDLKEIDG